jgi:heptosyltransferase-2
MTPPNRIQPRRLLVRGVNWLGDAVMATPALLRLRERFPGAHLALLTPEKLRDLWQHHPAVNETLSFAPGEGLFAVARKLRAGNFDLALVLPNSPRSALEVRLARIPERVGYARPWRNWLLTQALPARPGAIKMHKRSVAEIRQLIAAPETGTGVKLGSCRREEAEGVDFPAVSASSRRQLRAESSFETDSENFSAHQIHDFLYLAAALGANPEPLAPKLFVALEEVAAVKAKFQLAEVSGPILGLNPGAEYGPAKRWPVEHFIAAAREIQKRTQCTWLILGGKSDAALATEIQSAIRNPQSAIHNLAGQTSVRELCALLKLCRVLLTNDTGPMHVAAALDTPVVVPFGSTSPELTGPGLPGDPRHRLLPSDAPCSPCFLRECPIDFRCLKGISVERVVEAVVQVVEPLNR